MKALLVRSTLAVVAVVALQACGDAPTFAQPPVVASIQVSGCNQILLEQTCTLTAEAIDTEGNVMENPPLLWRSSSRLVVRVEGFGPTAEAFGFGVGSAQILVSDATGRVDAPPHPVAVTVP